jgi:serine/threonine protein kinase
MRLGRYQIVEALGTGGFGTVYKARIADDHSPSRWVALKVLNLDNSMAIDVQARLRDEERMLSILRHPSIVRVEEVVCLENRWTLVMEYLEGANLTEIVGAAPIPLPIALEIVARVADALEYAFTLEDEDGQAFHLIHRDIKPSNVQVTLGGEVKVLDFGVARAELHDRESNTGVHVLGSMHYMAPERFDGQASSSSDIYSLGVVLFEVLVGKRMGKSNVDMRRHEDFLSSVRQRLSLALEGEGSGIVQLVLEMLSFESALRPSASDVRDRCRKLLPFLDSIPLHQWAKEQTSPLVAMRRKEQVVSSEWPELPQRSRWAGDFESTDVLMWSTSGNITVKPREAADTVSMIFSGDFSRELLAETGERSNEGEGVDENGQFGVQRLDSQETTMPGMDALLRHSDQHWDPEDRLVPVFHRDELDLDQQQVEPDSRSHLKAVLGVAAGGALIISVLVGIIVVLLALLATVYLN